MKKIEYLKTLHEDNRTIKRNLQQLVNIGLIGLLSTVGAEANKSSSVTGKKLRLQGC